RLTGTLICMFLQAIGINVSLYDAAVYAPVILGVFGVLVIYFFARDIWGKSAGLLAALLSAFSSSLISRTDLGFFRNEAVGIPTMVMTFLFFIRAVDANRSLKATIIYSMLSSVSLIYMAFAWGSFRYAAEVLGLFTLALVVLKRYSPRLMLSYGITIGFFMFTGTELPLLGHTYLTESTTIALLGVMGVLAIMELARLAPTSRGRLAVAGLTVVGVAAVAILGVSTGLISVGLRGKFAATLNTFMQITIIELDTHAMDVIQQADIFPRRKLRFTSRISREFSLGILLIILILVVPTFINAVQSAYTPTTIASASLPVRGYYPDWI